MVPPNPTHPPLLIVGGMGPLAGAQAFEAALQEFGDTREIVLLQLCSVPDRTDALDADEKLGGRSQDHDKVVDKLAEGLLDAENDVFDTIARFGRCPCGRGVQHGTQFRAGSVQGISAALAERPIEI